MDLPKYLIIYAGLSAIIDILVTTNRYINQKITKYCPPILLLGMVTLYGFQMNKIGYIPVLVLAITCISSLYAEIRLNLSILAFSVLLFAGSKMWFPDTIYNNAISKEDFSISFFSLVIGQLTIIMLILFSTNALRYSKNKTAKIQELLEEVEEKRTEAESANKTKSDFLANMSHEIRTPMNAICGMVELLIQNGAATGTNGEYINTIKIASNNLLGIINDILDFSKIEAGKIEIIDTNYNFSSSVNDVINIISTKINHEKVAFYVNMNPKIPMLLYGDEIRVKQIMLNLLTNAAKFTNEGFVSLNIDYEILSQTEIKITIVVNDSGIGIKPENLEAIFGEFQQVDTRRNRNIQGTGLGLAITKRLCELMGGNIKIQSAYGVGTTFTVDIVQKIVDLQPSASVSEPEKLNVLLYDTNRYYLNNISNLFDYLDIRHESTEDPDEFYVLMSCKHYTHIFFDYESGIEQVMRYFKEEKNPSNTIVGITNMNKYGEKPDIDFDNRLLIISKPTHYLSIVPILNGEAREIGKTLTSDLSFIAPQAKVLLVDDNLVNLKVTEGLLKSYKMQVDTASGGFEAIDMIHEHGDYDIIFMDHMMPQIDGVDTTKIIRKTPDSDYCKNVPIIAFTANAVKDAQLMFLENGFNDFLAKPVEIKALKQVIMRWLPKEKQIQSGHIGAAENVAPVTANVDNRMALSMKRINVSKGLTSCMGDMDAYKDILKTFSKSVDKTINNINDAFKSDNLKDFTTFVHSVKSSAKSIGAMSLSDMALKLEEAGKQSNKEYISLYLFDFINEYKEVLREIKENLPDGNNNPEHDIPAESVTLDEFNDTIGKLSQALEDYDSSGAEELFDKLATYLLSSQQKDTIEKAKAHLEEFEYDEALELIKSLI